jgi:hypothetical protein
VDPPVAGVFSDSKHSPTVFTGGDVRTDMIAVIRVLVVSEYADKALVTKSVKIVYSEQVNHRPVAAAHVNRRRVRAEYPLEFFDDSVDPDGNDTIVKWEWDFSFDIYHGFRADSTERNPIYAFPLQGEYQVQLRVTDSGGLQDILDSPLWIEATMGPTEPTAKAVADPLRQTAGRAIGFHDAGSFDPDGGSIVKYEWDWDNDGVFDQVGKDAIHTWYTSGVYEVQFRVTDSDDGFSSVLEAPLEVTVTEGWVRQAGSYWDDRGLGIAIDSSGSAVATGYYMQYLSSGIAQSYGPIGNLRWLNTWGGIQPYTWTEGDGIAADSSGGVYVAGRFGSQVDFDPGNGSELRSSNGGYDAYLNKLDTNGHFQWVRTWGGYGTDGATAGAVDSSGSIYVASCFYDTADFDPGAGGSELVSNGVTDACLIKFSPSGEFVWARSWGGVNTDWAACVATDGSDSVYVGGFYTATVDFDPGPGQAIHEGSLNELYLSKFDSAGNFVWVYTVGDAEARCGSVAVDSAGNVYTAGYYGGWGVDFDPGPGTNIHNSSGGFDTFLVKLDSSGQFLWCHTWGSIEDDYANGVAIGSYGDVYVVGSFGDYCQFGPGWVDSLGGDDAFLCMLNSSGDFQWVRSWGGTSDDVANSIAVAPDGKLYITGYFYGTADFDPGPTTDYRTSRGNNDIYVLRLLPTGYVF